MDINLNFETEQYFRDFIKERNRAMLSGKSCFEFDGQDIPVSVADSLIQYVAYKNNIHLNFTHISKN